MSPKLILLLPRLLFFPITFFRFAVHSILHQNRCKPQSWIINKKNLTLEVFYVTLYPIATNSTFKPLQRMYMHLPTFVFNLHPLSFHFLYINKQCSNTHSTTSTLYSKSYSYHIQLPPILLLKAASTCTLTHY